MPCVKSGVVLSVIGDRCEVENCFKQPRPQLYGDLHVVGNCAIVYYPRLQHMAGDLMTPNGTINFPTGVTVFQRGGEDQCILVIQAKYIEMQKGKIHPLDAEQLRAAGGVVR